MKKKDIKKQTETSMLIPSQAGKLLISMPSLEGDIFRKSVVYVCEHNEEGAMGIIINQEMSELNFTELLKNMKLPKSQRLQDPTIYFGGPVDANRGFILHSNDFFTKDTIKVTEKLGVTATVEMVEKIAQNLGPENIIFAMGYAGWSPGQLENEVFHDFWLRVEADDDLIFKTRPRDKWAKSLRKLGVAPEKLNSEVGNA